jgi:hypothetical protein
VSGYGLSVICQSRDFSSEAPFRNLKISSLMLARPAGLEAATSWFVGDFADLPDTTADDFA